MTQFTARLARSDDVLDIVSIQYAAVNKAWRNIIGDFDTFMREKFDKDAQIKKYTERVNDPDRIIVVVENNDGLIGFGGARRQQPDEQPLGYEYQANAFYLAPSFEGSGASLILLSALFDALADRGAKNVCGWCLAHNRLARNFYERRGGLLIANAITPPEYSIAPHVAYGWNF